MLRAKRSQGAMRVRSAVQGADMREERFTGEALPEGFEWLNAPPEHRLGDGLEIVTGPETDFWQGTHYGFRRDDGHCLLTRLTGDFALGTRVRFEPANQYDQCGLIVRVDAENWIKVSTEYETPEHSRLGSVVTNLGYSDWATQTVPSSVRERDYRISRRGDDFLLESAVDGGAWDQLRIAHLHGATPELAVGVYACSPVGRAFRCRFELLTIDDNHWQRPGED